MTSNRVALLLGAALVLGNAPGVSAADLYGGSVKDSFVAPAPARSAAWYFRLDGTYSNYDKPRVVVDEVADLYDVNLKSAWGIGGGVGMYFSRGFRGDITYDHVFNSDVTGTAGINIVGAGNPPFYARAPLNRDLFLANLYYDFDFGSRFTPYIGAGIGFARQTVGEGTFVDGGPIVGTVDSHSSTHVAAAAMAGFSVQLTGGSRSAACCASIKDAPIVVESNRGLLLDVGYRFVYLGSAKTGDTHYANITGDPVIEDLHSHELRMGLRYNLQ